MAETIKTKNKSTVLWIAAVAVLVLIFLGVRRLTRQNIPLRVTQPRVQDLIKTTSTNGKVEPQVNFEAHAPVAAVVKSLYVQSGDKVQANKLLLQLEDSEARARAAAAASGLRGAEANLQIVRNGGTHQERLSLSGNIAKAKIDRDQAQADLQAVEKLESQGAAAPNEVIQAKQRLAAAAATLNTLDQQQTQPFAQADLLHAQSALVQAQSAYAAAKSVVEQCNVRAPFAGTVYSLPVSQYEYVQAGAELLQMADLSKLRIRAYFDEPEIGDLEVNDPVTIAWDAKPGRKWHGRIIALPSTIITYGTRNVGEVLVSVDDSDGVLLPNTNVTVTVVTQEVHNAMTIPREALHVEFGQDYVYIVRGNSLRRLKVKVGALNLTDVQILSGLSSNAVIALSSTDGSPLSEGVPIHIVN